MPSEGHQDNSGRQALLNLHVTDENREHREEEESAQGQKGSKRSDRDFNPGSLSPQSDLLIMMGT